MVHPDHKMITSFEQCGILSSILVQVTSTEVLLAARCKKVYANAHTYHINSVSMNSDQETFLSADDLRVNLWNLNVTEQSFNLVDIKPSNMEDLTEVRGFAVAFFV
jgi:serine/threonine-protein phosphatase 2A regulatory subunit B